MCSGPVYSQKFCTENHNRRKCLATRSSKRYRSALHSTHVDQCIVDKKRMYPWSDLGLSHCTVYSLEMKWRAFLS